MDSSDASNLGSVDRWAEVYGIPIKAWDEIEKLDDPLRGYINKRNT